MPGSKPQLLPLTGMRFFLALWIVIFHQTDDGYLSLLMPQLPDPVFRFLRSGHTAVSLFFVLSGFVLSYNYELMVPWTSVQRLRFGIARFARIYPAYCVGLLLNAPFHLSGIVQAFSFATLTKEILVALSNLTLLQAWIPSIALSWNLPGWSLSNEAFFYFCFPFIGVVFWRLSFRQNLIGLLFLILVNAVVPGVLEAISRLIGYGEYSAGGAPGEPSLWKNFISYNPLINLPQFCAGILVERIHSSLRLANSGFINRGYWLYIPGIICGVLIIVSPWQFANPIAMLLPFHALLILGFAFGGGSLARLLSTRPLIFLGNASYAMYIIHYQVAIWMYVIVKRLMSTTLKGLDIMALYVLIVIGLSAIVFKLIEEPSAQRLKAYLKPLV